MRRLLLVPAIFLIALPSSAEPSAAGTLCVGGLPCTSATLDGAVVPPAESARMYTWTAPDERLVVLGVVKERQDRITRTPASVVTIRLAPRTARTWPAPTEVIVKAGTERTWRLPLTLQQTKAGVDLRVEPGQYEIAVRSTGYQRATQSRTIGLDPVEIVVPLQPLPQIRGRVTGSGSKEPIAGAAIAVEERVVAVTGGDGSFVFEADPDEWPANVTITAGGYGPATIAIPRARAETDLLEIPLSIGASVEVAVAKTSGASAVDVAIYRRRSDSPDAEPLEKRTVTAEAKVRFEGLEPGEYLVLARGTGPAERYGEKISLRAGESKSMMLSPTPRRLLIRTEMADAPLPKSRIHLRHGEGLWDERLETDAGGVLEVDLWQLGRVSAVVTDEAVLTTPHLERHVLAGESDLEWTIRVSSREVRGRVVDAATDEPIANANVMLEVRGLHGYSTIGKADHEGAFVFTAAVPGEHRVAAAADGYKHDSVRYTFGQGEQVHEVVVRLTGSPTERLSVRDLSGAPVRDALVLDFDGFALTGERVTDAMGEVRIPIPGKGMRDVYVIPRDGSFAFGTIRSGEESTLKILPPQTTIVVKTVDSKQQPIPGVWLIMRYNGVALPLEVIQGLARQQGATTVSGRDGRIVMRHMPLGVYEFWPVGSPGEARATMMGLGNTAPVTIVARTGASEATLTFAEVKKPRVPMQE